MEGAKSSVIHKTACAIKSMVSKDKPGESVDI